MESPIQKYLMSEDPLAVDVVMQLVAYREEDPCLDYKLELDPSSEKEWLEITKDVSAFANTTGGYLLFGIRDRDKAVIGLPEDVATILSDVNNLLQKINRYLEPNLESLRSKEHNVDGKRIVALLIPQSLGKSHLISKDGEFKHISGKAKTLLRKGTFYVRRSAGNHIGDSRDLDAIVERRIDQFRESLMDKVARVVKAPETSEVFILSKDPSDSDTKRFIIEDSPESIPIKGMSFSVPPEGIEEEIAAWTVLSRSDSNAVPPSLSLWKWYAERENIEISAEHKLALFVFSLWRGVPAFYWIKGLRAQDIQPVIIDAIKRRPIASDVTYLFNVSSYMGKGFYKRALGAVGTYKERLNPRQKKYPVKGPRSEFGFYTPSPKQSESDLINEKCKELNQIALTAVRTGEEAGSLERWQSQKIDCFLYAQDDRYE